ncbi:hypothetical protein [Sphingobium aromaticiconvertens]|uniref:hypothetical protein n=1 Tax=Sphingobium aromaticiconvertens TaxID=365341 RepID=UPI00301A35E8
METVKEMPERISTTMDVDGESERVLVTRSMDLIRRTSPIGYDLWFGMAPTTTLLSVSPQDHADIVYSAYLLGVADKLNATTAALYQDVLAAARLYGRPDGKPLMEKGPNAHLTAYLLGAARLLQHVGKAAMKPALFKGWQLDLMIDARRVPLWPKAWTHHSWRVSHWIGGTPSILLQIAQSGENEEITPQLVDEVLASSARHIIDHKTGLLRPYKSALLQKLFKAAYRLRHDPDIGELGGVVHILWVFHAVNAPYVGNSALFANAWKHLQVEPFMEKLPYCLDFDIVQLARTSGTAAAIEAVPLVARATRFREDIAAFLIGDLPEGYTLHKLPGALATMHECALLEGLPALTELGIAPIDIIKDAYWL